MSEMSEMLEAAVKRRGPFEEAGYQQALRDAAAAIRAAGPATLRILPAGHTGEVVLVDLAEAYAAMVEGLVG